MSSLIPGHFVYCSDGCNDPPFQISAPALVASSAAVPLLSIRTLVLMIGALLTIAVVALGRLRRAS
ncbi:MAG TPA: hypothetical protein VMW17_11695 [Candidatus Binatia bacterium]|nr:hypothetical protein [Candidatus Binatia bacterium]